MEYLLVYRLPSPAKDKIQNIIHYIIRHFDVFDMRGIDPHITLKYYFSQRHLLTVEKMCRQICKMHKQSKFTAKGYNHFDKKVIYLSVKPSKEMRVLYDDLLHELKKKKVPLASPERRGIHFHITIAQDTAIDYEKIMQYLKLHPLSFTLPFDTLTILKFSGEKFTKHKSFTLPRR